MLSTDDPAIPWAGEWTIRTTLQLLKSYQEKLKAFLLRITWFLIVRYSDDHITYQDVNLLCQGKHSWRSECYSQNWYKGRGRKMLIILFSDFGQFVCLLIFEILWPPNGICNIRLCNCAVPPSLRFIYFSVLLTKWELSERFPLFFLLWWDMPDRIKYDHDLDNQNRICRNCIICVVFWIFCPWWG